MSGMDDLVEDLAKTIARRRMLEGRLGEHLATFPQADFDRAFERIWNGNTEEDERQREAYRADARAVLDTIKMEALREALGSMNHLADEKAPETGSE